MDNLCKFDGENCSHRKTNSLKVFQNNSFCFSKRAEKLGTENICVYACMRVCIYGKTYICIYVYMENYIYRYMRVCIYVYMCIRKNIHAYMNIRIHAYGKLFFKT